MNEPAPQSDAELEELVLRVLDALEVDPAALDRLCQEHPAHATRLRSRIRTLEEAGLLGDADRWTSGAIGDFHLLQKLGEGGMGVVWMAEQLSLKRRVALKLVRPDQLHFSGARARFQREVEAIAQLAHPSILQIHSVGNERGLPYYAMELVRGCSVGLGLGLLRAGAQGLDSAALLALVRRHADALEAVPGTVSARAATRTDTPEPYRGSWTDLALYVARQVALALAHAHDRGVLHRDVKPHNVLLDLDGRVLLADFGLASTSSRATDRITRYGTQMGSVPYMSPEQLNGAECDARTDVYGLGVTLYEFLCGALPHEGANSEQLQQRILEGRAIPLRRRAPRIGRDVELVVATAMERDPQRRYESAAAFAADLERLQRREPIAARPLPRLLLLRRWIDRRPAAAASLALGTLLTVGLPLVWAVQESRALRAMESKNGDLAAALDDAREQQRRAVSAEEGARNEAARAESERTKAVDALVHAQAERDAADGVTDYLIAMFQQAAPESAQGTEATVSELLARGAEYAASAEELGVDARARLASAFGDVYLRRGEIERAEPLVVLALDLARATHGRGSEREYSALNNLAIAWRARKQSERALALFEQALAGHRELLGPDHPKALSTQNNLAYCEMDLEHHARAVELMADALAKSRTAHGERDEQTVLFEVSFGIVLAAAKELDRAAEQAARAHELALDVLGLKHPNTLSSIGNLARVHELRGEFDASIAANREFLAGCREVYGPAHSQTLTAALNVAAACRKGGKVAEEGDARREHLKLCRDARGPDDPDALRALHNLGVWLQTSGPLDEARATLEEALAGRRRVLGATHANTLVTLTQLAQVEEKSGRVARALELAREALAATAEGDASRAKRAELVERLTAASVAPAAVK
jgi:serine/threonine protein kinase